MTLVARVSAFFLVALAGVLLAYSLVFYFTLAGHLERQFDEQLHSALHSLVASIEVESDGVKWQPSEHTVALRADHSVEEVRWAVFDEAGKLVEHSRNLSPPEAADQQFLSWAAAEHSAEEKAAQTADWRLLQQSLFAPAPKPAAERDPDEFAELKITVARSPAELRGSLRLLAMLVCLLPIAVWLLAFALGRWFCRRALQPVLEMAEQVRAMSAQDLSQRLPTAGPNDELATLRASFNSLLDQLQQSFAREQRFAADAAHQLRTPLTVLGGQIDVALRRPRTTEDYQQTLEVLREQTTELQHLVETLLFLARAESDILPTAAAPLAMDVWLLAYPQRWESHPRRMDLQVEILSPAQCMGSGELLAQLLDNLISNALKYSAAGTPVTMTLSQQAGEVVLTVRDRGIGIAADECPTVFEPFFRSPRARDAKIPGVGLGLPIAARIAQALGGRLACQSELGRGSCFTLTLPAST